MVPRMGEWLMVTRGQKRSRRDGEAWEKCWESLLCSFMRKTTSYNSRKYSSIAEAGKPVNDPGTWAIVRAVRNVVRGSISQSAPTHHQAITLMTEN